MLDLIDFLDTPLNTIPLNDLIDSYNSLLKFKNYILEKQLCDIEHRFAFINLYISDDDNATSIINSFFKDFFDLLFKHILLSSLSSHSFSFKIFIEMLLDPTLTNLNNTPLKNQLLHLNSSHPKFILEFLAECINYSQYSPEQFLTNPITFITKILNSINYINPYIFYYNCNNYFNCLYICLAKFIISNQSYIQSLLDNFSLNLKSLPTLNLL